MKKDAIYLDYNATAPLRPEARAAMLAVLDAALPGNASSVHRAGREARRVIEQARARVKALAGAAERDVVVFTSGATEANNLVLRGAGAERIMVSAIEHPSVLKATGAEVIPVTPGGVVDLDALEAMLKGTDRATLVSVMYVNNETGVIQPIDQVSAIVRRHSALLHVDAVQAAGRIPLDIQELGIDYLTISSHKIGGPQGAGALVMANCLGVEPQIRGGGQEKNLRAGTENVAAIAGFGAAADAADRMARDAAHAGAVRGMRDWMEEKIKQIEPDTKFFGCNVSRVTNTSLFAVPEMPSETQLIALDLAGVCVSNGSACSSGTVAPSHVLKAMGAPESLAVCALRVSLGWNTARKDVESFIDAWADMHKRMKA